MNPDLPMKSNLNKWPVVAGGLGLAAAALVAFLFVGKTEQPLEAGVAAKSPMREPLSYRYELPELPGSERLPSLLRAEIVQAIDKGLPEGKRIELIDSIYPDLSEVEYLVLLSEILGGPSGDHSIAWHSTYIHRICTLLQRVPSSHGEFANVLATTAADETLPEIYRDYAFQHLRILWRNSLDPNSPAVVQPVGMAIESTFRDLLTQRPETEAQALLGLHELRYTNNEAVVSDNEISKIAGDILSEPAAVDSISSRMTAIRILAERKIEASSSVLQGVILSDTEHSLVRASAVAALGHIASPANLEFLSNLKQEDPVVAEALRHAVKNL